MSKVTREEMLACIKAYQESDLFPDRRWDDELNAIRALIEHGPEVSEEWLRQKAGELSTHRFSNQHPEIAHDWLCRTFREAGVMVKEGK